MRRRWKVLIGGVAVCLVVVGVVLVGRASGVIPAPVALGAASWSSAVIPSRDARSVTIEVDVEHLSDSGGCGFDVRPHVTETATRVTVLADVFTHPIPANEGCAASALRFLEATVELRRVLGSRSLVDASDSGARQVLVVDRTPTLHDLPAAYRRKATGWDESTGSIGEWWRWQVHGQSSQLDLDMGPQGSLTEQPSPADDARHVEVGGAPAVVWTERSGDLLTSTLILTQRSGTEVHLTLLDESEHPPTEDDLVRFGDSLR